MDVNRVRRDFPIYRAEGRPVYLDSACQTLRPRQVIDAVTEYYEEYPGCAGRSIHGISSRVQQECDAVRESFAGFLGSKNSSEIVFTRNTTEGINLVIFGREWHRGDEVVCGDREHNSVLVPLQKIAERFGVRIRRVGSDPDERIDIEQLKGSVSSNTKLVVMCHTSNITGVTLPAKEIADIAHDAGAELLLDGAQSVPHRTVDVGEIGADYLAFSVHKMCGPSGIGVLYGDHAKLDRLEPLIYGGMTVGDTTYDSAEYLGPPQKFEAGLQNYAGIIGAGAALKYVQQIGLQEIHDHEISLGKRLSAELGDDERVRTLPPRSPAERGGIFSFNVDGHDSHELALTLDSTRRIMIRSGYHCCHSWFHSRGIDGCARASIYLYNDINDIETFASAVKEIASGFPFHIT